MAGIYIHIPFCKQRCIYCDFYSTVSIEKAEPYIDALCKEILIRRSYLQGDEIQTIYLGGGTPSLLTATQLKKLFDTIYNIYTVASEAEITFEANPNDLTPSYIEALRHLPINRISIGVQTFHDKALALLSRRHTARQAIDAIQRCQKAGYNNISIDLIYGLPQETTEQWQADIDTAIRLNVQHISAYHLTYEEGTRLWTMQQQNQVKEIDEESSLQFFDHLINRLEEAGFIHYEISNFARPGYRSKHNSNYWKGIPYLGCGAAAHSYDGTSRQWNIRSVQAYMEGIHNRKPNYEMEKLDRHTRYNEAVITSMRTREGLSLTLLQDTFGRELYHYCLQNALPYLQRQLLVIDNQHLKLTRKGIFVSDGIMSDLLWADGESDL